MRADPPPTRERLITATADSLQRRGIHATGLTQLLAAADAPKGSLYFHFPGGKDELAAAALERSGGLFGAAIEALLARSADPAAAVARLAGALATGLEASGYVRGCPLATVALEASSDRVRTACGDAFASWLDTLERALAAAGHPPAQARDRAVLVLSALEGALILARAGRDPAPLRTVADQLAPLLAPPPRSS